jgi:hypothetical protein
MSISFRPVRRIFEEGRTASLKTNPYQNDARQPAIMNDMNTGKASVDLKL